MTMPNFLIVGAQKAGTTSLHYYLKQHPQIYMSPRRAALLRGHALGLLQAGAHDAPGHRPCGLPGAVRRACRRKGHRRDLSLVPPARSPHPHKTLHPRRQADRHLATRRTGRTPTFCTASGAGASRSSTLPSLRVEEERIKGNWGPLWHYKQKGFYYAQVKRYLDTFGRDLFRVWLYEDLRTNP